MNIEEIITMITPCVVALFGIIATAWKIIQSMRSTVEQIKSDVNVKDLKNQVKIILEQNYELRNEIKELTESISKIRK